MESLTSGPSIAQIYLTLYHGVWWSNKFQYCPEVALIWSCFLFAAICLSLVHWCNPMNSLAILPIALRLACNWINFGWLLKGLAQWAELCDFWYISSVLNYIIPWNCFDMALFLYVAISPILVRLCNHVHSLTILPIASGLPKLQNPVATVRITNIEVPIAGGLRQPERAHFGDCGALRGLLRTPEHVSRSALESRLRPDQQPLG